MIKKITVVSVIGGVLLLVALFTFIKGSFMAGAMFAALGGLALLHDEKRKNAHKTSDELKENLNSQKKYYPILYVMILISAFWLFSGDETETPTTQPATETTVSPEQRQKSIKLFSDSLNAMRDTGLIASYDFSETSNVIYVSSGWYSTPVQMKKDFLTSLSRIKEQATGYHRLEVRDVYSNEKVAEVKAFSGSVEIYK